jgi:nitroimidazol reductase NimA-like FMN-containing flavoprotein (pyridoxamine 5'-phosphate oxidase superfamily)
MASMMFSDEPAAWSAIRDLLASQRFAVLATSGETQPYGSLVAFAETGDLKRILFVTDRGTRKYTNLSGNHQVALVIDNRSNSQTDVNTAQALTAIGTAREVPSLERETMAGIYLGKHPYLAIFLAQPSNSLVEVNVRSYVIAGFDRTLVVQLDQLP